MLAENSPYTSDLTGQTCVQVVSHRKQCYCQLFYERADSLDRTHRYCKAAV